METLRPNCVEPLRIFLSYGHSRYAEFARFIKARLEESGHEVWFDKDRIREGHNWEKAIEEGLKWAGAAGTNGFVVYLMEPHSVRIPLAYSLNEIVRSRGLQTRIIPVMIAPCVTPLSVVDIPSLDMVGCAETPPTKPFEPQFQKLLALLERD